METTKIYLEQCSSTAMMMDSETIKPVVDRPLEKGGGGKGLMGGQYLLIGIAGCFCSTLFAASHSRNIVIKGLKVDVTASISDDLPKRFTGVSLCVTYDHCSDPPFFSKLLKIAEKGCLAVNTIKESMEFKAVNEHLKIEDC